MVPAHAWATTDARNGERRDRRRLCSLTSKDRQSYARVARAYEERRSPNRTAGVQDERPNRATREGDHVTHSH